MKDSITLVNLQTENTPPLQAILSVCNSLLSNNPEDYLLNYLTYRFNVPNNNADKAISFLCVKTIKLVDLHQAIFHQLLRTEQSVIAQQLANEFSYAGILQCEDEIFNTLQALPARFHQNRDESQFISFLNNESLSEYYPSQVVSFYSAILVLVDTLEKLIVFAHCVPVDYEQWLLQVATQSIKRQQIALAIDTQEEVIDVDSEDIMVLTLKRNLWMVQINEMEIAISQLKSHGIPSSYLPKSNTPPTKPAQLVEINRYLAADEITHILTFLTPLELLKIGATNRFFYALSRKPFLWNNFTIRLQETTNALSPYFENSPNTYLTDFVSNRFKIENGINAALRSIDIYNVVNESNETILPIDLMTIEKALFNHKNTALSTVNFLHENSSQKEADLFIQKICFHFLQQQLDHAIHLLLAKVQDKGEPNHLVSRMAHFSGARIKDIKSEVKPIEDKLVDAKKELAIIDNDLKKTQRLARLAFFKGRCEPVHQVYPELNPVPITAIKIINHRPSTTERAKNVVLGLLLCTAAVLSLVTRDCLIMYALLEKGVQHLNKGLNKTGSVQGFFMSEKIRACNNNSIINEEIFLQNNLPASVDLWVK